MRKLFDKFFGYLAFTVLLAVGSAYLLKKVRVPPATVESAVFRPAAPTPPKPAPVSSEDVAVQEPLSAEELASIEEGAPELTITPLNCSATVLRRDDTLTIRPAGHAHRYLVILHPDGTDFFVIYPESEPRRDSRSSLMPAEKFTLLTRLDVKISELQGAPWVYGRTENARVFTAPGEYKIRVGYALESDTTDLELCTVALVD